MSVLLSIQEKLPSNLGGKYVACTNFNLQKAWAEVKDCPGLLSVGQYFIFQTEPGNLYDLAWALDQFVDYEERFLVWRETDGWAVLTMTNPKCEGPNPRAVRLKIHLTPQDHTIAQTFMQNAADEEWEKNADQQ